MLLLLELNPIFKFSSETIKSRDRLGAENRRPIEELKIAFVESILIDICSSIKIDVQNDFLQVVIDLIG